jgi:HD-GYP domain-containing protein (c-di-GMP phosphodiesterase class II)
LVDVVDDRMPYLRFAYFSADKVKTVTTGPLPPDLESMFEASPSTWAEILAEPAETHSRRSELSDPILLDVEPPHAVLVISAPVVSGGKFRGVLSALVDLQKVWDSVVERNPKGHVVFIVDARGQVVTSTYPTRVRPGQDVADSALVTHFLASRRRGRVTMPFKLVEDGIEHGYLGTYQGLREQGWGVFVQTRLQQIYLPVRDMVRSTLLWALAALALAIASAVFFARTFSQPINRLAAASRAYASGDFKTRVAVRSGNEIGELAHTFNRMASEIEDQIRRLRLAAEENRALFLDTIRALAQAIDAKDPYTRGHSVRVNRYSIILARQLGLSDEQIADIHVASLMHDVGKIGIHDNILQKPGRLTPDEFEVMKTHTTLGASIMGRIRQMRHILPGLRSHHERWKGGGYPEGLAGDEIPLMARIIAVADAFDAITTHRPYQTAKSFEEAAEILNRLKGDGFEERIVEAFNRAYHQGLFRPETGDEEDAVEQPVLTTVPA